MQKIKLKLLQLNYLLGALIVCGQVFAIPNLTSLCFYLTFFVSAVLWISTLSERFVLLDTLAVLTVIAAFISILINGILSHAHFSFDYLKKYIMFCCTVIYFAAVSKITIDLNTKRFLNWLYAGLGIILVYLRITEPLNMHLLNGRFSDYLTFRFTNPNLTALFLTCMIMFLICSAMTEKRTLPKIIFFTIAAAEIYLLFETQSRNAILAFLVFVCIALITGFRKWKIHFKPIVFVIVSVVPLVFALLYLMFLENQWVSEIFSFAIDPGKGLDSRAQIWNYALRYFESSPVFGAYYEASNGTGSFQLHNTHIDIMVSYGFPILLLICAFLSLTMLQIQRRDREQKHGLLLIGFMCAVMLGVGEAALFSGGIGVYLFFGSFLLIQSNST